MSSPGGLYMDDILTNKAATIERCLKRIRNEYSNDPVNLYENITKQDSIILNIQRACETAIDLAMHEIRIWRLGIPQDSRDAFTILFREGLISKALAEKMMAMVGFRNIAVHDYQELNLEVVQRIIEKNLEDFLEFTRILIKAQSPAKSERWSEYREKWTILADIFKKPLLKTGQHFIHFPNSQKSNQKEINQDGRGHHQDQDHDLIQEGFWIQEQFQPAIQVISGQAHHQGSQDDLG